MKKEISKYVGGKIKYFRKKAGMTQKELGDKIGVKHNTISSYENGTNEPEHNIIYSIAKVLEVSINEFFPVVTGEFVSKTVTNSFIKDPEYPYYPTPISAGLPINVDGITEDDVEKISIPDCVMGKWAGHNDIYITRVNGESMNRIIPDESLIAIKPVELSRLKDGDIVVYNYDNEYAVKRYYNHGDKIVFRPDSSDMSFTDQVIDPTNGIELKIKGKVVLWIVEAD